MLTLAAHMVFYFLLSVLFSFQMLAHVSRGQQIIGQPKKKGDSNRIVENMFKAAKEYVGLYCPFTDTVL